jgi:glycosyltransferase involved in cell wall biosynthesis
MEMYFMTKVKMIVTNRFDPDVRVYKEAKYLASKGLDVEILCWDREGQYKSKEVEMIDGIKIKRFFPYAKYGTGFRQFGPYFKFIKECKLYLENKTCDYIHCHDLDGIIVGLQFKKRNTKLIFDMHEFYELQGQKKKIRYLVRIFVNFFQNRSDYIIYVNEAQVSVIKAKNISKAVFIPNYPEHENYKDKKSNSKELRISYIGAVRQYEELKNLMEASKEIKDIKISIHGAGTAYDKLNKIKKNYKNVDVTGVYSYSETSKLFSETDILFALYPMNTAQYRIAFPVKFFEAIITKTPIIVSKDSILEKIVNKTGIGFVVDGRNINELTNLINHINNNKIVLQEKINNLEKIQFEYSWGKVINKLDYIYNIR